MKTKRVNLPNDVKYQRTIDTYLTAVYNKKGRFTNLQDFYEKSRKAESSKEYMTNPAIKNAIVGMQPDEAWEAFLYLAIGQKEAAYYLAVSFIEGLGAEQDDDLASLAMAIGIKLGDKKSKELAAGESFKDIKELTAQCVKQINKNAKEIGKRDIIYEEAIGRAKAVEQIVKTNGKLSFEDNILPVSIKIYANFVSLIDDNISSLKIDQKKQLLKLLPVINKELLPDKINTQSAMSKFPQRRGKAMAKYSGRS